MLIQGQQRAQCRRVQRVHGDDTVGAVAGHGQVGRQSSASLSSRPRCSSAACGLRERPTIRVRLWARQFATSCRCCSVMPVWVVSGRIKSAGHSRCPGAVTGGRSAAPWCRRSPTGRACGVIQRCAVVAHPLAIALHGELLQKVRQALQAVVIGQHHVVARAEEIAVPHLQQAHQQRHIGAGSLSRKCWSMASAPARNWSKCPSRRRWRN